jgi:hypothetical protein
MKKYVFQGYSDDGFYEDGVTRESIDNCSDGTVMQFEVVMPDGAGVRVTGAYDVIVNGGIGRLGKGCWMIGVETLDENKPVDWPITCRPSCDGYRGEMAVVAPGEARLCFRNRDGEREWVEA